MKNNASALKPGTIYHIYNHANGFENLFVKEENYLYFLKKYATHIPSVADTLAYCLMPNHIHLMVRIKLEHQLPESLKLSGSANPRKISKQFGNMFSAYAQAFNKQQGRKGSLFIPNFKRKAITNNQYYAHLIHYIHYNPVKDGFVAHPAGCAAFLFYEPLFRQAEPTATRRGTCVLRGPGKFFGRTSSRSG